MMPAILFQGCLSLKFHPLGIFPSRPIKVWSAPGHSVDILQFVWNTESFFLSLWLSRVLVKSLSCHLGRLFASRMPFLCLRSHELKAAWGWESDGGGDNSPKAGIPPFSLASAFRSCLQKQDLAPALGKPGPVAPWNSPWNYVLGFKLSWRRESMSKPVVGWGT